MAGIDYAIVAVFFVGIFAAGAYFYRWIGEADDFFVAGRKLTPFILAATLTATNVNLYSFVSQAGNANAKGISIIWQTWTGNMALVLAGLFIIPMLRRLKIRTVPEFLEMRYGRSVRVLTAGVIFLRLLFWLGIVVSLAVVAAERLTGLENITIAGHTFSAWHFWVFTFALIAVVYTILGGMWSVALTDVLQFVLMMAGALIILPIVMKQVGWWPGLKEALPAGHLELISAGGKFNWFFVLAIMVLGIQWASTDQGLIQRAFGAASTKSVARGMVLAGVITTPFAFLWIMPGLASRVVMGVADPIDSAVPLMLAELLPAGVLGIVICGFLASQMSTIDSNLTAAATLFVNDIYARFHRHAPSSRTILKAARVATAVGGAFMICFAYVVRGQESGVSAYLGLIAILDMPLFVIAILFGFFYKRANLVGALSGYVSGAAAGFVTMWYTAAPGEGILKGDASLATFVSAGAAIVVCFVASFIGRQTSEEVRETITRARHISDEEIESGDIYHIWPSSPGGRVSMVILALAFLVFLAGTIVGKTNGPAGSAVAVVGMVVFFLAGLGRLAFD